MPGDEDMNEWEAAGAEMIAAAYERWQEMPPARLTLHRQDAFVVLAGLQRLTAQPEMAGGPRAQTWERVGRAIQKEVCDAPELYALMESRWQRL